MELISRFTWCSPADGDCSGLTPFPQHGRQILQMAVLLCILPSLGCLNFCSSKGHGISKREDWTKRLCIAEIRNKRPLWYASLSSTCKPRNILLLIRNPNHRTMCVLHLDTPSLGRTNMFSFDFYENHFYTLLKSYSLGGKDLTFCWENRSDAHLHRGKAVAETPSNSGLIVFLCLRFICKEHKMNYLQKLRKVHFLHIWIR